LNKIIALIQQEFNVRASKSTMKRVLKSMKLTWRRIRRKVKDQPDPEDYQHKREALEILIAEDQEGIIDVRYFDESGFCLVPYIPYAWQEQGEPIAVESGHSKRLNVLALQRHL
jgi:hypothetical protein